ncbi:MAG: DUF4376 domain-containing protein [Desulfobulbia bacterium]
MYKLTDNPDMIIRTTDGACIPRGHRWWIEYEEWLDEGNTPEPVDTITLTLAETVTAKKAALAAYRYDKEVGGLTLPNGMKVTTDDRSKTLIAGARLDTMSNPTLLTNFKADSGWIQIDADTVALISTAVAAHVRTCFDIEKAHSDALDAIAVDPAKTAADIEAYDITTGWPPA